MIPPPGGFCHAHRNNLKQMTLDAAEPKFAASHFPLFISEQSVSYSIAAAAESPAPPVPLSAAAESMPAQQPWPSNSDPKFTRVHSRRPITEHRILTSLAAASCC